MSRLKSLLVAAAVAGAVVGLIRNRLSEPRATDPGGWQPVEPH